MSKVKKRKSNQRYSIYKCLFTPNDWLSILSPQQIKKKSIHIYLLIYLGIGFIFNILDPFPYFYGFVVIFAFIGCLCILVERDYCVEMRDITAVLAPQKAASKAKYFYVNFGVRSPLFLFVPVGVIIMFSIGGCMMYGSISFSVTLIWVMSLFIITVYVSIVGYLQYILLAIYIAKLSSTKYRYVRSEKSLTDCIPAEREWLLRLTRLTHMYRTSFFTLGSAYIIAFGSFCFLPKMNADVSSPFFFILWGIIFCAIVIVFPVVSISEYHWIKSIVSQLKISFIADLDDESSIVKGTDFAHIANILKSICVNQVINSKDYPIQSIFTTAYATVLSVINFIAAIVTIVMGMPYFRGVLPQLF